MNLCFNNDEFCIQNGVLNSNIKRRKRSGVDGPRGKGHDALKMMNSALKMMNSALKMMNSVLK